MILKNKLRQIRQANGIKQKDVAQTFGMTERQYRRIERETPKAVVQFLNIANFFNVTIDYLLEQEDDTPR